jgi:hypothetical protein
MKSALDSLLEYCADLDRVCPQPMRWMELWEMLPDRQRSGIGGGWEPPTPLVLSGWWYSINSEKMVRFRQHIEWAESHGCLAQVDAFIRGLSKEEWHYIGEIPN